MMTERWKSGRPREPSDLGEHVGGIEVTSRKSTTIAENLNTRQSGRLKQEGGRLRDDAPDAPSGNAPRSRQRRQRDAFGKAGGGRPSDGAETGVSPRRDTTLADELGMEPSGRLKQGQSRQHRAPSDAGSPTSTRGRRLGARGPEDATAPTAGDGKTRNEAGGRSGKLRPSKAARHALRLAGDAAAAANSSAMGGGDDEEVGEKAIRQAWRRLAPTVMRAVPGIGKSRTPGREIADGMESPVKVAGSRRLRDVPAFSTAPGGRSAPGSPSPAGKKGGVAVLWKRSRWKRTARAEAAARRAAATGEAGTLRGLAALRARLRRMFVAGGAVRGTAVALAATVLAAMLAMSALSTCSTVGTAVVQAAAATSYTADDADIKGADAAYTQMEAALEGEAQSAESTHPGYDEYRYQIGELGHDPYALASILTARYGDYRSSEVTAFLGEILDAQYDLTFEESTETETVTTIDENGREHFEETTRRILTVRLVNHGLDHAARQLLTPDELASYEATYAAKGNRDDLFPAPYAGNNGSTGAGFDWRPSGEALSDAEFAAMFAEGSKYLGWRYVWGGGSPETGFDCSGFVSWVLTKTGVCNTGHQITDGLLTFCTQVSREKARPGDLVFFSGTYETDLITTHVGIYLGDGMMMHCGDPIQITSIDTPYWQAHLYGFGRVK